MKTAIGLKCGPVVTLNVRVFFDAADEGGIELRLRCVVDLRIAPILFSVNIIGQMIDVFIPLKNHPTYEAFLPSVLESIEACVQHRIHSVYIICARRIPLSRAYGFKVEFVPEEEMNRVIAAHDGYEWTDSPVLYRPWIRQQIYKLHCSLVSDKDHVLIADADLLFLKPITFFDDDGYIFYMENEFHPPYFKTTDRLIGVGKLTEKALSATTCYSIVRCLNTCAST